MKGLLYKDFKSTRKETWLCLGICVIFLLFSVVTGASDSPSLAAAPTLGVMIAFGCMAPTYSLQYDKTSGWNRFLSASPISRNKAMLVKYLWGMIHAAVFSAVAFLANSITGSEIPLGAIACIPLLILALQAVMLPVCLRFGQNTALVAFLFIVFLPLILGMALNKAGILDMAALGSAANALLSVPPALLASLAVLFTALLYLGSYAVSCRLFRKMEF